MSLEGTDGAVNQLVGRLLTKKGMVARGMERGLKKAALFLQAESQKIVPVDTGNLKNSAYTRTEGSGFETTAEVGYTADYAIYVHEDLEARHKPGKYAMYLLTPALAFREKMIDIITKEAKKG